MPRFVIWVSEIDSRLSRKYGRAVSRSSAVRAPRESEVFEALNSAGVRILERRPEKLNPRLSGLDEELKSRGMFIVESDEGKTRTLRIIAQRINELRSRKKPEGSGRKRKKRKHRR